MKIVILVNTLNSVNSFVYGNHIAFFTTLSKKYPDMEVQFFTPYRMSIDTARNNAAKIAMETEADYLMFLDDDVMVPKDALQQLIESDKDIVAGLVIVRGMPFNVMAFKKHPDGNLSFYNDLPLAEPCANEAQHTEYDLRCPDCQKAELIKLVPCGAVGFSCCLIKTEVLYAMEPPFFLTGTTTTEDVYFCLKTRELEPNPGIYLNTAIRCGHLLNSEPIEFGNRAKMTEFYKPVPNKSAHGIHYIDKCLAAIK